MSDIRLIIGLQIVTYGGAGSWFLRHDNWRLGVAQLLLAAVQGLIFFH